MAENSHKFRDIIVRDWYIYGDINLGKVYVLVYIYIKQSISADPKFVSYILTLKNRLIVGYIFRVLFNLGFV